MTTQKEKALLKGKVVEVLEEVGSLAKVQPEGGEEFEVYWAKITDLKPYITKEALEVLRHKRATKGKSKIPVFLARAMEGDDTISEMVTYLQRSKYRLYLSCKPEFVGVGENEYLIWTGGEVLPEGAIRVYENAYGREWFLTFEYSADIQYPVSVIERGTGGGQGTPSILHKNGRCELCYWQVIEQLVRAGLRA
jgi:hypothetical protein